MKDYLIIMCPNSVNFLTKKVEIFLKLRPKVIFKTDSLFFQKLTEIHFIQYLLPMLNNFFKSNAEFMIIFLKIVYVLVDLKPSHNFN